MTKHSWQLKNILFGDIEVLLYLNRCTLKYSNHIQTIILKIERLLLISSISQGEISIHLN